MAQHKIKRIAEETAKAWCEENGCIYVGFFNKGRAKHDSIKIRVLNEIVKVTVPGTPRGGPEKIRMVVKRNLNRALLQKMKEFEQKSKQRKDRWKK